MHLKRDARGLAKFCKKHQVEEVVIMFAAEEWNNGLLSKREEDRWFFAVRQAKAILDQAGIRVSLNPWMTVNHASRGRRFPRDRRFAPMVSPLGEQSKGCASFADSHWQDYICKLYGRFAQLGFRVIWVEDDFRYHNHAPLTWGGGFEPAILQRFSRKIGRSVDRPTLVRCLLKPGRPHPWRAKWMETWRELQIEVAQKIARSVEQNSSGLTRIGLMSSNPRVHSVEGRDWKRLFDAFSINGQVAHRPHFAYYDDQVGKKLAYSMMTIDSQKELRPPNCEVAPEVENFPFTKWNKSDVQTWSEMALALFHGSDALLLDLFPFAANHVDTVPEIGELLDRSQPVLEWIGARFDRGGRTEGVGIPWRTDAASRLPVKKGESLHELVVSPIEPGFALLANGIPVSMSCRKVNAIFGLIAWIFDDTEVCEMLKGGLLLDGVAADILCRRGYGQLIGVNVPKIVKREESDYSVEKVVSSATGLPLGFYFNHNLVPGAAILQPRRGAREWISLLRPTGQRVGSAMVVFRNELGGRVTCLATTAVDRLPGNNQKQILWQQAVRFLSGGKPLFAMVTGGPHLMPLQFEQNGARRLVVFNGSPDESTPVVTLPADATGSITTTLLCPLKKPVSIHPKSETNHKQRQVICRERIPSSSFFVVEWTV